MGNFMIPVCCCCGNAAPRWHDAAWEAAGVLQDFCPEHAKHGQFTQYLTHHLMPTTPKTYGETIASNLNACQIISERDVERVAKQIDDAHRSLVTALENTEEFLTKIRDTNTKAGLQPTPEFHDCLRDVRLVLHSHGTGELRN